MMSATMRLDFDIRSKHRCDCVRPVPVKTQHLGEDQDEYHRHEDLRLVDVCAHTLQQMSARVQNYTIAFALTASPT